MQEKSSGAVIYYQKGTLLHYLILHYEAGHWDFPKGHIEKGENEEDAAKREAEEESGIKNLGFEGSFRAEIHYFFKRGKEVVSKDVTFFIAKSPTKDVKLSFEHIGYSWLSYAKALKKLTYPTARDVLKKVHAFLEGEK